MRPLTQQEIDNAPEGSVCYMIRQDNDTPIYLHRDDPFAWCDSKPIPQSHRKLVQFKDY